MISKVADFVDRQLGNLAAWTLAGILCVILWQVVSRSLLGTPSSVTGEIARFLGIWLGLLAAAESCVLFVLGSDRRLPAVVLISVRLALSLVGETEKPSRGVWGA